MNDDTISRQAAINELNELYDMRRMRDEDGYVLIYKSDAISSIESLPSVQPERKKGKWIEAHDTSGHDYFRCSKCGTYIETIFFANDYEVNFCPNCGADMMENKE